MAHEYREKVLRSIPVSLLRNRKLCSFTTWHQIQSGCGEKLKCLTTRVSQNITKKSFGAFPFPSSETASFVPLQLGTTYPPPRPHKVSLGNGGGGGVVAVEQEMKSEIYGFSRIQSIPAGWLHPSLGRKMSIIWHLLALM